MKAIRWLPVLLAVALVPVPAIASEIHDAVKAGDAARVTQMAKADPAALRAQEKWLGTPLHTAVLKDKIEMARLLVSLKAEVDAKDAEGTTPLFWAARDGRAAMATLLLDSGADAKTTSRYGDTPLHAAADGGHQDLVALLLARGTPVDVKDTKASRTPLMVAARQGRTEVVALLIAKGADVNAKDANGETALAWAKLGEHKAVIELLAKGGAR
jgi:ankyrin repeat protein